MALLFVALLGIGFVAIVQHQSEVERGVGTYGSLPNMDSPVYALPFVGINADLEQYESSQERIQRLEELKALGFGWVRQRISWSDVEPQSDEYDWRVTDAIISDIRAAGLEPVIVLYGAPSWAQSAQDQNRDNNFAPPKDPDDFAAFANAFAVRYGDQVRYYQIWDEPNIAPHWGERWIDPVGYAQLLRAASVEIRSVDDDAVILLAALAPTWDRGHQAIDEVHFLHRLYAAGAAPYFDAATIQLYGFGARPDDARQRTTELNFMRAQLIRRAMVAAGDGETPLLAVRFGWNRQPNTTWGTVPSYLQASFTSRALDIGYHEWPWLVGMGYAVDQPAADPKDAMWGFSLNETMEQTFAAWSTDLPLREALGFTVPHRSYAVWMLLLSGALLALYRATFAFSLLPLQKWRRRYLRQPWWFRTAVWLTLLLVYYFATWPPLIIACWALIALLILAQPTAGLLLAVVLIPFHTQHKELIVGDLVSTAVAPSIAITLCLLPAMALKLRRSRRSVDRWDILALAWLLISLLAAIGVWHWPAYVAGMLQLVVAPLILYTAVRLFISTSSQRRQVMLALVIGGVLFSSLALMGWLRGGGTEVDALRRLTGPTFSPNHAALLLERSLFVAVGLSLYYRGRLQLLSILATAMLLITLLMTASRGALLLGLPVGFGLIALFAWRRRSSSAKSKYISWPSFGLTLAFLLLAAAAVSVSLSWERVTNISTVAERFALWRSTLTLISEDWLTGIGPGGFEWHFPAAIPAGASLDPNLLHPHNVWLESAAIGGLFAVFWLLAALVLVVRTTYKINQCNPGMPEWPTIGLLAAFASALSHAQVDAFAALPDLALWNWMAFGLLAAQFSEARIDR